MRSLLTTAPTAETRSGDRVRNGMVIAGMGSTGAAIILDPYITAWMAHQTRAYGVVFDDPQGWKSAAVQLAIVAVTTIWGVVHMRLIRRADSPAQPPPVDTEQDLL